ncbi:MAG TPA: hypothetical protein VD962_03700, partial [Rubricoccaceae bacterium]|nr:hypothetical protein [Rubricoccaceae bacterium]
MPSAQTVFEGRLVHTDPQGFDEFGIAVAASQGSDGAWRLLVGAFDRGPNDEGAAYVYRRDTVAGAWALEAELLSPTTSFWFGRNVSLLGDLALPGDYADRFTPFLRNAATGAWEADTVIAGFRDRTGNESWAAALPGGAYVAVTTGATGPQTQPGTHQGALFVFRRGASGQWAREDTLVVPPVPPLVEWILGACGMEALSTGE